MCTATTFVRMHDRCLLIVQIKKELKKILKILKRESSQRQDGNVGKTEFRQK